MARLTGPTDKINRRFQTLLFGPSKVLDRRKGGPGQHGKSFNRKTSDFKQSLIEKQKLRFQYGIMEKQFRKYFQMASKKKGVTGEILLQLLETRLDNVVYMSSFGKTRRAARQIVNHGHILVNGRKVDIASYSCKVGDVITLVDKTNTKHLVMRNMDQNRIRPVPEWIELNREKLESKVLRIPTREEIAPIVNEQLIVEFYSR